MSETEFFDACLNRINQEILPLVENFPPTIKNDADGLLSGSVDLLLYRNLVFTLEFCFRETDSRLTSEQLNRLRGVLRRQVLPAYLNFFKNYFLSSTTGQASSYFYVRQENNATWAKVTFLFSIKIILELMIFVVDLDEN